MKPKDGAFVLILSRNKMLLFHRDNIQTIINPDCWQLVGGGIEEGETPEEGLVREVKEEVCFDLENFEFVAKVMGELRDEVWVYVGFVEKEEEDKFKLGPDEGQEIGWFTVDEALKLKLTLKTKELLTKHRDLIEKMMKTKMVPSLVEYKL